MIATNYSCRNYPTVAHRCNQEGLAKVCPRDSSKSRALFSLVRSA